MYRDASPCEKRDQFDSGKHGTEIGTETTYLSSNLEEKKNMKNLEENTMQHHISLRRTAYSADFL